MTLLFMSACSGDINSSSIVDNTPSEFDPYRYVERGSEMKNGTMLHYTHPLGNDDYPYPFIGDVHPFFDEKSQTWYMYYLDTSGMFHTKLMTSKDGLSWKENNDFWIHSGFANYAVLNVFEKDGIYYSYYADYQCSKSTDLVNWEYCGGEYQIPADKEQFPGGVRDPSVTYDEETKRYYSIGLNYPRRVISEGIYQSNLAIGVSDGDTMLKWLPTHKKVFSEDAMNKDFECPQLVKINNRWYVVFSQYGNSVHGVGRTSYLIGDEGKNPYEVDWTSKTVHHLNTEDLCAAQIAKKGDKFYIFGWLPRQSNGSFWGGYLNLPTEVYPLEDGTLAARLDENIAGKIRGNSYFKLDNPFDVTPAHSFENDISKRFDIQLEFTLEDGVMEVTSNKGAYRIVFNNTLTSTSVEVYSGNVRCFLMDLRIDELSDKNDVRIIGESKNLEIFLNDKYALTARIDKALEDGDKMIVTSNSKATIHQLLMSKLRFLEEIQ